MIDGLRTAAARLGAAADELAEVWLGYAVPPAERALDAAGFAPDDPDHYCGRCGGSMGRGEARDGGCASCRARPAVADRVVRLGPYAEPLRWWILQIKYHHWSEMGLALGRALGRAVRETEDPDPGLALVVPMPMPFARRLYRGIDHARVIAEGVARELSAPLLPLLRRSNGPPQITLGATDRRRTAGRGMRLGPHSGRLRTGGRWLIIVDDVCTTGGSLRAARRRLRPLEPQRTVAAVVAVADDPRRRRSQPSIISKGASRPPE